MKYSLMSLMIDELILLKKPTIIHRMILHDLGYNGPELSLEETFRFLNDHGIPVRNGTMTFGELVRFAKEAGFDSLDLMDFHFEEEEEDARKILEDNGVSVASFNILTEFGEADTEEKFEKCLSWCRAKMKSASAIGCPVVMLMPTGYVPGKGITREETFHYMVRGLRACVEYGKELGITVCTETLESPAVPLCSIGDMLRLFDAVPGLKYAHDTGNPMIMLEDPVSVYELFKDRAAVVHFKDLAFTEEKTRIMDSRGRNLVLCPSGEGIVDLKKHLELLRRDNYQGSITIEGIRSGTDKLKAAEDALRFFRELEKH